jgi:RNA polymerase sigma factor (sigma-70 family)
VQQSPGRASDTARQLEEEEAALRRLVLYGGEDADAAEVVVRRVVPRLALFLRWRFRGLAEDDSYDLAGEALTVVLERRAAFDPARRAKVRTWLYGIAAIRAADFLRRRGEQVPLAEEGRGESQATAARRIARSAAGDADRLAAAAADIEDEDEARALQLIRRAILELPAQQRVAALARYVDGLPPQEIDRVYGWRPNTANVYLSYARKAIRRRLAAAGIGTLQPPAGDSAAPSAAGVSRAADAAAGGRASAAAAAPVAGRDRRGGAYRSAGTARSA